CLALQICNQPAQLETDPFVAPLRDSLVGGWQNLDADIKLYDFKNKKLGFHLFHREAHDCSMTT
ncbi:hypothetical protein ACMGCH_006671, partial [Pseudomonas aeruginosa]